MKITLEDYKVWRELMLKELECQVDYKNEDFYLALVTIKSVNTDDSQLTYLKEIQSIEQSLKALITDIHIQIDEAYDEECAMNGDDITVDGLGIFYATKEYGEDRALTHHLRGELPTRLSGAVESGDLNYLVQKAVDNGIDTKETYFVVIHWQTLVIVNGEFDVHATNLDYAMTKAIV